MNFQDGIHAALRGADFLVARYLDDLADDEIFVRPVPDANHIAWQLGHLIAAERHLIEAAVPGSMPELPPGFAEAHKKDTAASDDRANFLSKQQYLELAKTIRAATLRTLDSLSAADFDKPVSGRVPPFVKRAGDCFTLIANHWALHAGQWVIVRRKLHRERLF